MGLLGIPPNKGYADLISLVINTLIDYNIRDL